jgi:hypothetical protein
MVVGVDPSLSSPPDLVSRSSRLVPVTSPIWEPGLDTSDVGETCVELEPESSLAESLLAQATPTRSSAATTAVKIPIIFLFTTDLLGDSSCQHR